MARPRRGVVAAAVACAVLVCSAPADALRSLHVDALSMRADRAQPHLGEVFHLAIHAHVRERVSALDELVMPDVGTMQLEGDERHVAASPSGTDIVETLTLEPMVAGSFTFAPAYLDAIDARTRRPSRFSSNPVRVVVIGPRPESVVTLTAVHPLLDAIVRVVLATVAVVVVAVVALVLVTRARRRRPVAPPAPAAPPVPAPAPRTPRDAVRDALAAYRVTPSTVALLPLRATLFAAAGVPAGGTLRDALRATSDAALRAALEAAERAAFGPAFARDAASRDLVDAVEAWLR